jgi:hypothetical protein
MSKQHIQNLAEQMANKGHGSSPFHYGKKFFQTTESLETGNIQKKVELDISSIQLEAYHIYRKKGGTELENWLEAEQILKNEDQSSSSFINEGNPNT